MKGFLGFFGVMEGCYFSLKEIQCVFCLFVFFWEDKIWQHVGMNLLLFFFKDRFKRKM